MLTAFIFGPLIAAGMHHHPNRPLPAPNQIPPLVSGPVSGVCKERIEIPSGLVPGWRFEEYDRNASVGGLAASRPLGVGTVPRLPTNFANPTSTPRSSMLRAAYVRGQFVVCEEGTYNFSFLIEAPQDGVICSVFLDVDRQRTVEFKETNIRQQDLVQQFTGKDIQLSRGLVDIGLWVNCAQRRFSGFGTATVFHDKVTAAWLATTFTIQVRGPSDAGLREFKPGEVVRPK